MVKRILTLLNRELGGLHKAALLLASSTFISSLLALFRDQLLASHFGASRTLDIYYASFKIPDLMYTVFLSVASGVVLIPMLLGKIEKSEEEGRKFISEVFFAFSLLVLMLSVAVCVLIPYLVPLLAPGFSGADKLELIKLARILLSSSILLALSNIFSSVVQSYRKFFVYALSPILYNLGIIIGVVVFFPTMGLKGMALGVILGAFMHMAIQVPVVLRLGFAPIFNFKINYQDIKKVIFSSFPRTVSLSSNQLTLFFVTSMASLIGAGSISVFNLSYNLQSVPLNIIALSFSVAAFPLMAQSFVRNEKEKFFDHAFLAMKQIILWSLPIALLFIVLRAQIVRVIFGYGNFGWVDTRLTAASLAIFSFSMIAQSFILLFTRAYFAAGKTIRPTAINVSGSILIVLFSYAFLNAFRGFESFAGSIEKLLRVTDVPGSGVLIFPIAFALGNAINAIVLYRIFKNDFGVKLFTLRKIIAQSVIASLLLGFSTYFTLGVLDDIFNIRTVVGIFFQGFAAGVVGLVVWFVALKILKNKEILEIEASLKQKFWKEQTVMPNPQNLQ